MSEWAVVIGTLLGLLGSSTIANAEGLFQARLTGDQEVPAVETDTTGRFKILVNNDATAGEYTLSVDSGVRVTQAHFHCAPAGTNGPVIVFLAGFRPRGWGGHGEGGGKPTITQPKRDDPSC